MIGSLRKKSISLLLAVAMLLSMLAEPMIAVAETYDYQNIYRDGGKIKSALLCGEEKFSVYVKEGAQSYQWQIRLPSTDLYVSIYDMTGETCELSYALVGNMLDAAGETKIRCLLGMENGTVTAGPIRVRYTEEETASTATPSVPEEPVEEAGFLVEVEMIAEPDAEPEPEICEITEEEPASFVDDMQDDLIESEETGVLGSVATPSDAVKNEPEEIPEIVEEVKEVRDQVPEKAETGKSRALGDAGDGLTTTCTVTVKYLRYDEAPAQTSSISIPYIAVVPKGSVMTTTLTSPIRTGYTPYLATETDWNAGTGKWTVDKTTATAGDRLSIDISSVQEDVTYYVIYMPNNATYHIRRLVQDIYTDEYNVYDSIEKTGEIGSTVPAEEDKEGLEITGFTQLIYEGALVAGDNTTEVDIYYDRNYYLINFELDGGYGTEPIYARYETEIKAVTPERAGYMFNGWQLTEPSDVSAEVKTYLETISETVAVKVPAFNITFEAQWGIQQTTYQVVYWLENANPESDSDGDIIYATAYKKSDGTIGYTPVTAEAEKTVENEKHLYSYWGAKEVAANSDSIVSGSDDVTAGDVSSDASELLYFEFNDTLTDKNVRVLGDGSAVVNVYYKRPVNTLNFTAFMADEVTHHEQHCWHLAPGITLKRRSTPGTGGDPYDYINYQTFINDYKGEGRATKLVEYFTDNVNTRYYQLYEYYEPDSDKKEYVIRYCMDNGIYGTSGLNAWSRFYKLENYTYSKDNPVLVCDCDCQQEIVYTIRARYQQDIADQWPELSEVKSLTGICKNSSGEVTNTNWKQFYQFENAEIASTYYTSKRYTMTKDMCTVALGSRTRTARARYNTEGRTLYNIDARYMFESFDQDTVSSDSSMRRGKDPSYKLYNNSGSDTGKVTDRYYDYLPEYSEKLKSTGTYLQTKSATGFKTIGHSAGSEGSVTIDGVSYRREFLYYKRNRHAVYFTNVNETVLQIPEDDVTKDADGILKYGIMYQQPVQDIMFEDTADASVIKPISEFVPGYPSTFEPNAYEFAGWYTTPDCYDGTEADFSITMPDADLRFYAKWVPVIHTVRIFNSFDDLEVGTDEIALQVLRGKDETTGEVYGINHGSLIPSSRLNASVLNPQLGTSGGTQYTFEGWFYLENGEKKAFKFDNMPVNSDLDLFAEWKSNELIRYTIHYTYRDNYGKEFEVAEPTTGTIIAGMTKTFSAKAIPQLYDRYQTHYFPESSDQSIMFTKETYPEGTAEYTFYYRYLPYVNYTVQYLDAITGDPITTLGKTVTYPGTAEVEEDHLDDDASIILRTDRAITTERFAQVAGFLPDEYQKKIILTADFTQNVIQFYYTADDENGLYYVSHLVKTTNAAGTTEWVEKSYKRGSAANGTVITESALSIAGYKYEARPEDFVKEEGGMYQAYHVSYVTNPDTGKAEPVSVPVGDDENVIIDTFTAEDPGYGTISGTVQSGSVLILRFYYELEEFPYTIYHRKNDTTGESLMWTESGEAEYGTYFTGHALDFSDPTAPHYNEDYNGYHLQAGSPEVKTQRITSTESLNVITFYYDDTDVELRYVEVYTDGSTRDIGAGTGYVTQTLQVLGVHSAVNPIGSTAVNTDTHYCAGWFTDEACTQPVNSTWVTTDGNGYKVIVPQPGGCLKENATYYALFKPTSAHLRINKTVSCSDLQAAGDGTFVFHISGPGSSGQVELDVTLTVDSTTGTGSVLVTDLPLGSLTVTEDTAWSWRYRAASTNSATVDLVTPGAEHTVDFTNTLEKEKWLDVADFRRNIFKD